MFLLLLLLLLVSLVSCLIYYFLIIKQRILTSASYGLTVDIRLITLTYLNGGNVKPNGSRKKIPPRFYIPVSTVHVKSY